MEWAAAIGVASGILTFVSFAGEGLKLVRALWKDGSPSDHAQATMLSKAMGDAAVAIESAAAKLRPPTNPAPNSSGTDDSAHIDSLAEISKQCRRDCDELIALMNELKIGAGSAAGGSKVKKSLVVAKAFYKNVSKRSKFDDLEDSINKSRAQAIIHLQLILRDGQFSIQAELRGLSSSTSSDHAALKRELEALNSTITQHASQLNSAASAEDRRLQAVDAQLTDIRSTLAVLLVRHPTTLPETRILKHLRFPSIHSREDQIRDPNEGTFEWILGEPTNTARGAYSHMEQLAREGARNRFLSWLTTGNGIFHISGKAGSGKSTLMKALTRHPRTMQELERWADGKRLLVARFFFSPSGDEIQNSLVGLYRSILFEVLERSQELIPHVFPDAYSAFLDPAHQDVEDSAVFFRPDHVKKAFSRLISSALPDRYRLCFFIDGLDEYGENPEDDGQDVEHHDLARKLKTWAQCSGIKILASSRPGFDRHFADSMRFRLHELTRGDLFTFTRDFLRRHQNFHLIENGHKGLCREVVNRAEGVFLWARYVARLLHSSLSKEESLATMSSHLNDFPETMEKLYASLLERLDKPDQERARILLLYAARNVHTAERFSPISALWVDEWNKPGFPVSSPPARPTTLRAIFDQIRIAEQRIQFLTQGLLECQVDSEAGRGQIISSRKVVLYHRSVRDFVTKDEKMREASRRFPGLANGDMFYRLRLAELLYSPVHQVGNIYEFIVPRVTADWHIPGELMGSYLCCLQQHYTSLSGVPGSGSGRSKGSWVTTH